MPTDNELLHVAKNILPSVNFIVIRSSPPKFHPALLLNFKECLPSITHVYGPLEAFNVECDIPYMVINENQMRKFKKRMESSSNILETYRITYMFIGVQKDENESLVEILDPLRFIFGGA